MIMGMAWGLRLVANRAPLACGGMLAFELDGNCLFTTCGGLSTVSIWHARRLHVQGPATRASVALTPAVAGAGEGLSALHHVWLFGGASLLQGPVFGCRCRSPVHGHRARAHAQRGALSPGPNPLESPQPAIHGRHARCLDGAARAQDGTAPRAVTPGAGPGRSSKYMPSTAYDAYGPYICTL